MAEVAGNAAGTGGHWQCILSYSTSEDGYSVTIAATAVMRSNRWAMQVNNIAGTATVNGQSASVSGQSFSSSNSAVASKSLVSKSVRIAKGQSAQSIAVSAQVRSTSSYLPGTSTASVTVTVPALASHTVSYNANGGSGAPGAQTKWYGTVLTLSGARPTRAGYSFLGWATSSGGSVAYQPDGQYGADANVTLYAVWKLDYVAPSITAGGAHRTTSATSSDDNPVGGYVRASCTWRVDTSVTKGNTAKSASVQYRVKGSSSWTSASISGFTAGTASGTFTSNFAVAEGEIYEVRLSVTDSSGQASSSASTTITVGTAAYAIDFGSQGRAVGILATAPAEGLRIGGNALWVGTEQFTTEALAKLLRGA